MKRSAYLTAGMIAALTACKANTVTVGNNTVTAAANTTASVPVNEVGVDNNVTSTGVLDVNNMAVNSEVPPTDVNQQ